MNFFRLVPAILSMLLLAAHFYRAGLMIMVIVIAAVPFILFVRRPWSARLIQSMLLLGGAEWIRTLHELVSIRQAMGAPWERLALILGAVAVLTISSAFVFQLQALKKRYGIDV